MYVLWLKATKQSRTIFSDSHEEIEFLADGEDHSYEEQLKVINRFHFEEMLTEVGLTITKIFGNYDLSDFDSSKSPRLILIAKKNA